MSTLAARLAGACGWRRTLLLLVLGALATLAMPPVSFTPALLLAFPGLVCLLDGSARGWRALLDGWLFGFGFFVTGLYWVSNALLTDAEQFAWLVPFAVAGLPALLALFTGAAALLFHWLRTTGPSRVLTLAVVWTIGEWARGHAFTGFPWNLVGTTWDWSDAMLQANSLIGVYGLSLLTVLVAAAPAALASAGGREGAHGWLMPSLAAVLVAAGFVFGFLRLAAADNGTVAGAEVRIVQANIAQQMKWEPDQLRANVERHLTLTRRPGIEARRIVVWPETALPYDIERDAALRSALGGLIAPGALLATGVPRAELDATGQYLSRVWNSVAVLDSAGVIVGTYDKAHLVPFGEYVPLRPLLASLGLRAVTGFLDHSAGPGPRTLALPGVPPVSPLICYEAIFPAAVAAEPRPGWLLNVTNDGWYGASAGPYQHFASARIRAVEEGLPLVRAANTGISGVIDSYGRVRASLGLLEEGVVDSALPVALPPTLYARLGDLPLLIVLGLYGAVLIVVAVVSRKSVATDR